MLAIHRPSEVAAWIHEVLFADEVQHAAFVVLSKASELHEAIAQAPAPAAELLRRLVVSDGADDIDAEGTLVALVREATLRALAEIDVEARLAGGEETVLAAASQTSRWLKEELEVLRDPVYQPGVPSLAVDAAERLLAWLVQAQVEDDGGTG
jgi:hypothetical protein